MACPDRMKDARIIAEVEKRKAMKMTTEQVETAPYTLLELEGNLTQIVFTLPEPDKVISIEKVCSGKYMVKIEL